MRGQGYPSRLRRLVRPLLRSSMICLSLAPCSLQSVCEPIKAIGLRRMERMALSWRAVDSLSCPLLAATKSCDCT